jgi:diguanylate cyclase (GGDEF)-like protein
MTVSVETGYFGAVMLSDLDDFKNINDTLGHRCGDDLLVEISNRFAEVLGDRMALARLGGDEFLVVLNTRHADRNSAINEVTATARQLLKAAIEPTEALHSARPISTSIGIVLYKDTSCPISEIMRMADIAMYDAKNKGKNSYSLFDDIMQKHLLEEQSLAVELNAALSLDDEIVPWFQPKVDQNGLWVGFEALARWEHPHLGLLSPDRFIDLAEKNNLMIQLGDQILRHSCHRMNQWRQEFGIIDWTVSVNISQSQLGMRDFPEKVQRILSESRLPAGALVLEITESVVAENILHSIRQMEQLTAIGVRFSLDDFGTGYSSLSYLRELPIDELKIDRSFIESLLHDEEGPAIVKAILSLAHGLKLSVVAEGIEERDQWQALQTMGCECFQGYFFSRPQPSEQIQQALEQGTHQLRP